MPATRTSDSAKVKLSLFSTFTWEIWPAIAAISFAVMRGTFAETLLPRVFDTACCAEVDLSFRLTKVALDVEDINLSTIGWRAHQCAVTRRVHTERCGDLQPIARADLSRAADAHEVVELVNVYRTRAGG